VHKILYNCFVINNGPRIYDYKTTNHR
jgi:hypothetical protein